MSQHLDTLLIYLKGVGQARAELLKKELQLETFADLLQFFPYRYIDKTQFTEINKINEETGSVQLKGVLKQIEVIGQKRGKRLTAWLEDGTGRSGLVWFNSIVWLQRSLKENAQYLIYGKPDLFNNKFSIKHPEMELLAQAETQLSGKLVPVYSTTQKLNARYITSKTIAKLTLDIFEQIQERDIEENLPKKILEKYRLINRYAAVKNIHHPINENAANHARRRLKFEELFIDQIKILRTKQHRHTISKGFIFQNIENNFNEFYKNHLSFELTNAQKRVMKDIRKDVLSGKQMNRLLQGDVGSGKTIVALLAMLMAVDNNYQAALMAPTEILAQQHYENIKLSLEKIKISVALLTGNIKGKERKNILSALENNEIKILIGTHALIEETVKFNNLGIVVIDEQHRFGVEQRAKMWMKNELSPHILVMTATPIPRTLAMTYYGDLDVSIIDELPPGRKEIKTLHYKESHRLRVFGFMQEQIKAGRQIYIVYPLIEESEKVDLKNVMEGIQVMEKTFPKPQYQIGIVHGRMKSADKEFEMNRFLKNETQIMVATTVIEVGVNIPNATVMIVENAERFGLSQLHQLRGRVGRGSDQSFCILMTDDKLTSEARVRIKTMIETTDGFKISEVDMQLRGPGEIEGTRQSGVPQFRIADIIKDENILREARLSAEEILENDPQLNAEEHLQLKKFLNAENVKVKRWGKVS
ncbi:MAG: ATP-dependent DNA helicase RecG [Fimbriimonadaceae bacterium]|nr:ATP-dependent DNA helicase RecG [Chitinophagales bacterium]